MLTETVRIGNQKLNDSVVQWERPEVPVKNVANVPVSHELDKCVPPQVFTYPLSF